VQYSLFQSALRSGHLFWQFPADTRTRMVMESD
jgi:hypothetical protein